MCNSDPSISARSVVDERSKAKVKSDGVGRRPTCSFEHDLDRWTKHYLNCFQMRYPATVTAATANATLPRVTYQGVMGRPCASSLTSFFL